MELTIDYYVNKMYQRSKDRQRLFLEIPEDKRKAVFLSLRRKIQFKLLQNLPKDITISLLEALDPDDATDVLQLFSPKDQKKLMNDLSEDIKDEVSLLLRFDQATAGGLMTLNYIQVSTNALFGDVAKRVKIHEERTGKMPEILVIQEGNIIGYVPGYSLGLSGPDSVVKDYIKPVKTIYHGVSDSAVLDQFKNHPHDKLVVVDENSNALGIIYSDDVIRVLREQESASLYDFAGVHEEEDVTDSAFLKFKFRYKWLIINLATAFFAAFTVSLFENTLNKYVLLAVYMPIVAGMGGNAATQTLAVMVRGIALKQITFGNFMKPLMSELTSGFFNGLINGLLVFSVVMWANKNFMIGLVLAIAMIVNLLVAAFFGTIVPLIMKKLNKDPAASATIFITTATDVLGFLAFLGLATILLR